METDCKWRGREWTDDIIVCRGEITGRGGGQAIRYIQKK